MTNIQEQAYMHSLIAEITAISIEVEGMKAFNKEREGNGMSIAYDQESFCDQARQVNEIVTKLRNI